MSPAQSEKKGTKRPPPDEEEAIVHSKNRQKREKEVSKIKGVYLTPSAKYKVITRSICLGTFDTKEAAIHAYNLASGKTKEQLQQELQEKKAAKEKQEQQAIREKVAAGQRVTVSRGVVHLSAGNYQATIRGIKIGKYDTAEAAKDAIKMATGKTKEQLEDELQEKKAAKEKQEQQAIREKVAAGQRVTVSSGVVHLSAGKFMALIQGKSIGTFDTEEAAKDATQLESGQEKEQLKQELQEIKDQAIQEKVAAGQRVTVSPGVTRTMTGKFEARSKWLYHGSFDTEDAAKLVIVQWKNYPDKHKYDSEKEAFCVFKNKKREEKRLEKVALLKGKKELRVAAAAAKQEQRVATGYVGVADRKMKITNSSSSSPSASPASRDANGSKTDWLIYRGAQRLKKVRENFPQALSTRTPVSADDFFYDSNTESTTATKMILKVPTNSEIGVYGSFLVSIDENLNATCAYAITTIGACGSVDTKLIPLSGMVVYCRTNGLDKFVAFFESVDTQIEFVNAMVKLVPEFMAVVQQGTPDPDRNIMMQVLQHFFPRLGGENDEYKPTRLPWGDTKESQIKSVSSTMVTASIYLPNGKMDMVCNQMYHDQQSSDDRQVCQRMRQMTSTRVSGSITCMLDFPRQPFSVRAAAKTKII